MPPFGHPFEDEELHPITDLLTLGLVAVFVVPLIWASDAWRSARNFVDDLRHWRL